jgi:hypothetical protein
MLMGLRQSRARFADHARQAADVSGPAACQASDCVAKGWSFLAVSFFVGQLESLRVLRKDPFIARGTEIPGIRKSELIV